MLGFDAWKRQDYLLNRMTMRDLVRAYVTYPGVQIYLVLIAIFTAGVFFVNPDPLRVALSVGAAVAVYSLAWYLIHRFILHSRLLYKSQFPAALWKRVHYDHHRYPNDMGAVRRSAHHDPHDPGHHVSDRLADWRGGRRAFRRRNRHGGDLRL